MPEDPKTTDEANEQGWRPGRGDRASQSRASQGRASQGRTGAMKGMVQAEELMQIAFVLPCGMLLGWGAGYVADRILHAHWATVTGLVLGIVLGMVSVVRTAMRVMRASGTDRQRTNKQGR